MSIAGWFLHLRRDRAVRCVPLWILATALNTSFLVGIVVFGTAQRTARGEVGAVPEWTLFLVLWMAVAFYLTFGRVRSRCGRLDLALPLTPRRLWLSHSVAVYLSGALLLAASLGVVAFQHPFLGNAYRIQLLTTNLVSLAAHLAASLLLAVALLQSPKPGLWKIPVDWKYVALLLSTLVAVPGLSLLVGTHQPATALVPLSLAGAVAWRTYRFLPDSFTLVPLAPAAADRKNIQVSRPAAPLSGAQSVAISTRRVLRLVASTVNTTPPWGRGTPWLLYPLTALMGMVLAGIVEIWVDVAELKYLYLPLVAYLLFANTAPLTHQLHRLDPLPIPRRILFAIVVLPGLGAALFGFGAGRVLLAAFAQPTSLVEYRIQDAQQWVSVPWRFMKIAWNGDPPRLSAPWGEEHAAWKDNPIKGTGVSVYSPFNTPEDTSAAFESLLTSRAIEAVYSESIAPDEIMSRYFEVESDRLVGLAQGGLELLEDYPALRAAPSGPVFLPMMLVAVLPALVLVGLFFRTFRSSVGERGRLGFFWGAMILFVGLMLGEVAAPIAGWVRLPAMIGLFEILIHRLGESTLGWLAAWLLAGLLTITAYLFAQAQFVRAELPAKPTRFGLKVGWSGQ